MAKKFDKSVFIAQFKEETNEHLARLEKDILFLEKNPKDAKLIEEMMRQAHTLKGCATMMGYKRIADLAHKFEDAILQIKEVKIKPTDAHFELLFKLLDTIKPLLEDKLTWPDKGVAYPAVSELEKKIDKAFAIAKATNVHESMVRLRSPLTLSEIEGSKAELPRIREKDTNVHESKTELPRIRVDSRLAEPTESIRVDVGKLSQLMNLVGELVVGKIGVDQRKKDLGSFLTKIKDIPLKKEFGHIIEEFERTADEVGLVTSQLQERVMDVRMLPLEVIFRTFPRLVHDLSKNEKKLIEFEVSGEETELDKTVIEKIQDPLMHLLRNAVSHGIESSQERKKLGKPEAGRIDLRAYCKGSQVIIEVEDDGRGIDAKKVKQAAIDKGILSEEEANQMSDPQALYLLSTPGLSTEKGVSLVSGRGVGLNVVKTNVTQLKGTLEISSGMEFQKEIPTTENRARVIAKRFSCELGKGTKFTIKLPLTLAITLALFVKAYNETFAIPLDNIEETLRIAPDEIKKVERREAISVRDEIIPLIRLGEVLGLKSTENRVQSTEKKYLPVVIVGVAERKLAILVDELAGKLEVVAKSLGDHLKKVSYIAGATILGTGEVVLILDIPVLTLEAAVLPGLVRPLPVKEEEKEVGCSILVVEDSLITRDLEKSILEAAGYRVGMAKDGLEALRKLTEEKFALVLADIAMPGMDGIELINRMKQDERFSKIPVVVISAKESDEDKRKGLEAGASAYLVKSEFDQTNLLDAIERLIG